MFISERSLSNRTAFPPFSHYYKFLHKQAARSIALEAKK